MKLDTLRQKKNELFDFEPSNMQKTKCYLPRHLNAQVAQVVHGGPRPKACAGRELMALQLLHSGGAGCRDSSGKKSTSSSFRFVDIRAVQHMATP
jgi:hypothetical protein